MILMSFMFLWIWQRCNIFLNSSAGISVSYEAFSGIYSSHCCNTRRIVIKSNLYVATAMVEEARLSGDESPVSSRA
jgi:hypothetical protein